jgi:peptidyl-dipeptidase Dcp
LQTKHLIAASLLALGTAALAQSAPKPAASAAAIDLTAPWTGPYDGVPPWDQVRPEQFPAAFRSGIDALRREMRAIADNPAPATFANTIEAMERAGEKVERVQTLFGVETSNMSTPAYEALEAEWSPKLTAAYDEITLDPKLFARIDTVYAARDTAGLDASQKRLLTRTWERFVRDGAKLTTAQKAQLSAMNQELAKLFTEFGRKLLADESTAVIVTDEAKLAGVPESVKASYKAEAAERKQPGFAIKNTRSAVDPLLTFGSDRALRQQVWRKFVDRGDNGDANDTNAVIKRIVKIRADRAHLLGFPTHAAYRMQDTMAKDPKAAQALMMRVWPAAVGRVKEEVADMQALADADAAKGGPKLTIEPWDYRFYMEKVRRAKFDIDQAELKPYFELDNMIQAAFWSAGQLYGLQFKEITGTVPVFEPNVRVWNVTDAAGRHVALFYGDYFARTGKRSGAWMNTYRAQRFFPTPQTAIASNNNNFTKAPPGEPVLISLDDASTLFHEFGHAIHFMLYKVKYPGLANVPRDFVEFPSQVNENWLLTREVLDRYARHYQTKQPMPAALLDKVERAKTFNQGFATVEYLGAAIVDMDLHLIPDGEVDPDAFEKAEMARIGMPKEIVMRHRLPQFGHLFSDDGYSAGYYSYLWSDTMGADTWAAFTEAGSPWDKATAKRFADVLLSTGNETDRAEAYRAFRGRDPDVKALLAKRGFPTE